MRFIVKHLKSGTEVSVSATSKAAACGQAAWAMLGAKSGYDSLAHAEQCLGVSKGSLANEWRARRQGEES